MVIDFKNKCTHFPTCVRKATIALIPHTTWLKMLIISWYASTINVKILKKILHKLDWAIYKVDVWLSSGIISKMHWKSK